MKLYWLGLWNQIAYYAQKRDDLFYANSNNIIINQMNQSLTFLVIPSYNESTALSGVIAKLLTEGWNNIVVVDDGSQDDTISALAKYPTVHVLQHEINRGSGAATQTGITYALSLGAEYIVLLDADGQHDTNDISKILEPVCKNQSDISIGTRFADSSQNINMPFVKKIILRLGSYFTWLVSGVQMSDPHNGFKALNRNAAQKMKFTFDRFEFCSEIIDIIKREKLKFTEVPSKVTYTAYTIAKGQKASNSLTIGYNMLVYKLAKILFN